MLSPSIVIATIFTLVITGHGVWTHLRSDFVKLHGKVYLIARVLVDFILFLMWIGTATLMLRPRTVDYTVAIPPFPPDVPWAIGIAFSFVEMWVDSLPCRNLSLIMFKCALRPHYLLGLQRTQIGHWKDRSLRSLCLILYQTEGRWQMRFWPPGGWRCI